MKKTEKELLELLTEYFYNKDKIKDLKSQRADHRLSGNCDYHNFETGYIEGSPFKSNYECKDATHLADMTFCDFCKVRHKYYLEINKLAHRNTGIMCALRAGLNIKYIPKNNQVEITDDLPF